MSIRAVPGEQDAVIIRGLEDWNTSQGTPKPEGIELEEVKRWHGEVVPTVMVTES